MREGGKESERGREGERETERERDRERHRHTEFEREICLSAHHRHTRQIPFRKNW